MMNIIQTLTEKLITKFQACHPPPCRLRRLQSPAQSLTYLRRSSITFNFQMKASVLRSKPRELKNSLTRARLTIRKCTTEAFHNNNKSTCLTHLSQAKTSLKGPKATIATSSLANTWHHLPTLPTTCTQERVTRKNASFHAVFQQIQLKLQ